MMNDELCAARGGPVWGKWLVPAAGLILLLFPWYAPAQSFVKLVESADQSLAEGRYAEAGPLYEQAARLRQNRPETMALAADCYYQLRDYAKAAECYGLAEPAMGKNDLARLHYGRSLKQAGRPAEALPVLRQLVAAYAGANRESVAGVANLELQGCQLALQFIENQQLANTALYINRLSDSLNSPLNELAPIRWADDVLYFFTKARGHTEMMRSLRHEGQWQPPRPATGLPPAIQSDLGSGTLATDGSRFYCTRCPEANAAAGAYPACALYITRRTANGAWGEPERLRDYLHLPGSTMLTPFVTNSGERELLFFASDRPGGFGGLDLYRCERPLDADELDFSFPQNLGPLVNSAGDELAPFFDPASATLWFSSNGHATVGGLDVFQARAVAGAWISRLHLAPPFNSPADDLFFVPDRAGRGGMLVSNRLFGAAKSSTRHNDLFEIQPLR